MENQLQAAYGSNKKTYNMFLFVMVLAVAATIMAFTTDPFNEVIFHPRTLAVLLSLIGYFVFKNWIPLRIYSGHCEIKSNPYSSLRTIVYKNVSKIEIQGRKSIDFYLPDQERFELKLSLFNENEIDAVIKQFESKVTNK